MRDVSLEMKSMGYNKAWIDCGILTLDEIKYQHAELLKSEELRHEHFRYRVLLRFLNAKTIIDPIEFEFLLNIAEAELDDNLPGSMGESIFHEIVKHSGLTVNQILEMGTIHSSSSFDTVKDRCLLLCKFRFEPFDESFAEECVVSGDKAVQIAAIEHKTLLSERQIAELSEIGATKAVRHLAGVRLKRLKKTI